MTGGIGQQQQQAMGRCGPSQITYKNLKFLITDKPNDATLSQYIDELKLRHVTDVVRVCESTYSSARLQEAGITVHDWAFDDGTPPPQSIIKNWLSLLMTRFGDNDDEACVAVHCVAGLGRAPVLVAIALVEAGMKFEDAVETIRRERRGAINAKQLQYLSQYKSRSRLQNRRKANCFVQ
ncbi:protein tyrosine phosphatase type IVA 3-like [Oppia nitens]|uniref:protein tyrosine phosphatase type IVA 3-like n=1 Tax=Oppia nitens TaxID=1686743 RepID=UPI0023DA953A|nr:protein tyrosine phosphatase type IVA 3-like [Oppia nitens]